MPSPVSSAARAHGGVARSTGGSSTATGAVAGEVARRGRRRDRRVGAVADGLRGGVALDLVDLGDDVVLGEGRHAAHRLDDPRAAGPVRGLALLPLGQHGRGDEDRRVGTGGDADHHREGEVLQRLAAEDQQHADQEDGRQAGDQRSRQHLAHRAVDDLREGGARHPRHVLADAVEDDDRVVHRVTQDGQEGGDRPARHLLAHQGIDARRDQDVVDQGDQHRHRVLGLEPDRDVGGDHEQGEDDRDHRLVARPARRRSGRRSASRSPRRRPRGRTSARGPSWTLPVSCGGIFAWIWTTLSPKSLVLGLLDLGRVGAADVGVGQRVADLLARRGSARAIWIRVPDSKSMPRLSCLVAKAIAPIARITPEIEKKYFDARVKSKFHCLPSPRRRGPPASAADLRAAEQRPGSPG